MGYPSLHNKGWKYWPSVPAAGVATAIFVILTVMHSWKFTRTRLWFCMPFIIGGLTEIFGYAFRIIGHENITEKGPYVGSLLLTLLSPICFAASIYMILGRLIRVTGGVQYSIIPINRITKIFLSGDLISLALQGGGGAMISKADTIGEQNKGKALVLVGLAVQLGFFGLFVLAAVIFHRRFLKHSSQQSKTLGIPWQSILWLSYLTSLLITVRNVYRVVEFAMGTTGYLWLHEWSLYAFDGLPMAITMLVCLKFYNPKIQPIGDNRARPRLLQEEVGIVLDDQTQMPNGYGHARA